ncbi:MAG TPA: DUF4091 domain-containing protein [Candidatus Hydrogenedentes bacterium]|nr:DUF4091 domain-containing protein [Candidatus Hydrogenedentota bacterium]
MTSIWGVAVAVLALGTGMPAHATETAAFPDPILFLDFEAANAFEALLKADGEVMLLSGRFHGDGPLPTIGRKMGIAGTACVDLRMPNGNARPCALYYEDVPLLDALADARSLSVTGWIRANPGVDREEPRYILNCRGRFSIVYGVGDGCLGLDLCDDGEDHRVVRSTPLAAFLRDDRWLFFGVTYDGTREADNAAIYFGTERYPTELDRRISVRPGPVGRRPCDRLVVGGADGSGVAGLDGLLDHLRLFARSNQDGSAALSLEQVEAVRRRDLGKTWLDRVAHDEHDAEAAERVRLRHVETSCWSLPLNVVRVDALDRVFADQAPEPAAASDAVGVPRGVVSTLVFGVMSRRDAKAAVAISPIRSANGDVLDSAPRWFEVVAVPVEANNHGAGRTAAGVRPSRFWLDSLVREAPFEVAEPLIACDTLDLKARRFCAMAVEVDVPADAAPGVYLGVVHAEAGTCAVDVPFSLRVYPVTIPAKPSLHVSHWFWPQPENVCRGNTPDWWSEEHWRLIKNSGQALRAYGQDTIFTPIIDGKQPLIRTIRAQDGAYTFDFARFDRWAELFFDLGFETLEGHHVGGDHEIDVPPMASGGGIWLTDAVTGASSPLVADAEDAEFWLAWLPAFYDALYAHLVERGWTDRYVQCQLDEPRDPELYRRLAELARKHLPGIATKDAINSRPGDFSPFVDIPVFSLTSLAASRDLAAEHRAAGQSVWLYHCASPYPPYPNRHLDDPLTDSRLYPWLAYLLDADGYCYWGANAYRGADPYVSSVGPLPNGSQNPGHPPGDNWMFYPTADGIVPGMRMVAFREGLIDHALLTMLATHDKAAAETIVDQIVRSVHDYTRDPEAFYRARIALLETLSQ